MIDMLFYTFKDINSKIHFFKNEWLNKISLDYRK